MTDKQANITARGYLNPYSGTWHYLKRCSGRMYGSEKMSVDKALEEGHDLCGVCADRFAWMTDNEVNTDG